MEFREKLKELRRGKRISQQTLADAIYVSRSAVAKWENGLGYPGQASVDALAAYFGVEPEYFQTEQPETVIVHKNRNIRLLRWALTAVAVAAAVILGVLGYHWFSTVPSSDAEGLVSQAEQYLGSDALQILKISGRGDYLAALCVDAEEKWWLCVFDRDPIFQGRYYANGGKVRILTGELTSWNFGDPEGNAVLIFCGGGLPSEMKWYTFSNAGVTYTCPVEDAAVLDIFIIPGGKNNINASPIPLNEDRQPLK